MSASSGKKRWSMSANSGRQSVCLRIHSIIRSTAYFCSSGVNSLPGRMPCHLNRHWRQQVAVACWAMNTGWPRIGRRWRFPPAPAAYRQNLRHAGGRCRALFAGHRKCPPSTAGSGCGKANGPDGKKYLLS